MFSNYKLNPPGTQRRVVNGSPAQPVRVTYIQYTFGAVCVLTDMKAEVWILVFLAPLSFRTPTAGLSRHTSCSVAEMHLLQVIRLFIKKCFSQAGFCG